MSEIEKWIEEDSELSVTEPDDTTVYRITKNGREAVAQVRAYDAKCVSADRSTIAILVEERRKVGLPAQ